MNVAAITLDTLTVLQKNYQSLRNIFGHRLRHFFEQKWPPRKLLRRLFILAQKGIDRKRQKAAARRPAGRGCGRKSRKSTKSKGKLFCSVLYLETDVYFETTNVRSFRIERVLLPRKSKGIIYLQSGFVSIRWADKPVRPFKGHNNQDLNDKLLHCHCYCTRYLHPYQIRQ